MQIPRCCGGEFRIPAVMCIFSLNIVEAGTASLLVSIPTVTSGFLKYHAMGHMGKETTIMAIIMGSGSILGHSSEHLTWRPLKKTPSKYF